jgi:hypothetical protein
MQLGRDAVLRIALLAIAVVLALIFANLAASLHQVWQLDTGAPIPAPWDTLLDAGRATQRTQLLSLVGFATLAGASLGCAIFVLERALRDGWSWLRDQLRR